MNLVLLNYRDSVELLLIKFYKYNKNPQRPPIIVIHTRCVLLLEFSCHWEFQKVGYRQVCSIFNKLLANKLKHITKSLKNPYKGIYLVKRKQRIRILTFVCWVLEKFQMPGLILLEIAKNVNRVWNGRLIRRPLRHNYKMEIFKMRWQDTNKNIFNQQHQYWYSFIPVALCLLHGNVV